MYAKTLFILLYWYGVQYTIYEHYIVARPATLIFILLYFPLIYLEHFMHADTVYYPTRNLM